MGSNSCALKKFVLYFKNKTTPPSKPSIKYPQVLELKVLPSHQRYAFVIENNTLPGTMVVDSIE